MFVNSINSIRTNNQRVQKKTVLKASNNPTFGMATMSYARLFNEYASLVRPSGCFSVASACSYLLNFIKMEGEVLRPDVFKLFNGGLLRTTMRKLTENNEPNIRAINEEADTYGINFVEGPEGALVTYFNAGRQNASFFERLSGNYSPNPQLNFKGPGIYNHIQLNISYDTNSKMFMITKYNSKTDETNYMYSNS